MPTKLDPYIKAKRLQPNYQMVCAHCGNAFIAHHQDAKYCSQACRRTAWAERRGGRPALISVARVRAEEGLTDYKPRRKQQINDTDVLESLAASLSPDVLAICLEVRAQNSRKHQPAARVGGD
jgi:ribosomal protein S27AE